MRIEVIGAGRPGLASDVLAVLEGWNLSVRGVEVAGHRTYLDLPELPRGKLTDLTSELLALRGVCSVREIDLLPGECQRMQFEALLNALSEPLIAVDMRGNVISINDAASATFNIPMERLVDQPSVFDLLGTDTGTCLDSRLKSCAGGEVMVNDRPYLVDVLPVLAKPTDSPDDAHGAVFIFRSALSLGRGIYAIEKRESPLDTGLVGCSPAIQKVEALLSRFAHVNAPLLITGETGTGKELVARACHRLSPRSQKPFLALNCAALPESLAESELFGYAAGAFSGAQRNGKPGLFELAEGGTVFLDEIGEMSAYLQAKLLRFLQDGTFVRIGGKSETTVDIRVVAATHRDLPAMVREGTFREDLFYRLNVLSIHIPPLRERKSDIPDLVTHFSQRAAAQVGKKMTEVATETLDRLCSYPWPGNARQMENVIFRAVTLSDSHVLTVESLPDDVRTRDASQATLAAPPAVPENSGEHAAAGPYASRMKETEKTLLEQLYQQYPSTRKLAAQLGLSHTAVAKKLKKFGIERS
ncbi:hypothetical protein A6V36_30320 [Paraburkholderia ginsengiterrae]|uniref:HTH-type transcriptional regulatory protein TyrR n=1 Tax=Paraburkholderia ginsengiterrae TaxID=1462993 RepID=A0A1A9N2G4_9BURK|nr:sigma 54-interacting transcriptional regulator [Paraburkholderia ginsengiterrae]OAJ55998.1 hypothetical protein A6V37_32300 [Paraburkholderia ginsengiterrae]OAJ58545.1 hypothetical protein A6V36_30320 [Paraburkholderia ginsengiterrae]